MSKWDSGRIQPALKSNTINCTVSNINYLYIFFNILLKHKDFIYSIKTRCHDLTKFNKLRVRNNHFKKSNYCKKLDQIIPFSNVCLYYGNYHQYLHRLSHCNESPFCLEKRRNLVLYKRAMFCRPLQFTFATDTQYILICHWINGVKNL